MTQPNIIFIVADDLGFADLGCYGGRISRSGPVSPILDGLAANGLKLTDGYSNAPVCSPTRFALMTMRYQYRLRGAMEEPIASNSKGSAVLGLPPEIPTLPSLLKKCGYRTALIGKWHLGYPPHFGPRRSGYDEYYGVMAGGVDYFSHRSSRGDHDFYINENEQHELGYLTDLISRRAVSYIDSMSSNAAGQNLSSTDAPPRQPFFVSLHYTAPHWPWETRDDAHIVPEVAKNIFHLDGGNIHSYHRMIQHMDEGIGWIMAALRKRGIEQNTLVVFTSDNGGERFSDNWPLVGGKMDLTEGGIRVPWIAHWPRVIPGGSVSAQQCMTMDWSATMLEAAGAKADPNYPLDGISILPVLHDPALQIDRPLFWRMNHRGQRAYRDGDWKYLRVDGNDYLFNLAADARERANLAAKHPKRLDLMRSQWEQWNTTMPPIPPDAKVNVGYSVKDMPQR